MSDISQLQSALFSSQSIIARRASTGTGSDHGMPEGPSFQDVLAKAKPAQALQQASKTAADQMWESKVENRRDRRKQERQEEYKERVDQQSGARIDERAGIKARQAKSEGSPAQNAKAKRLGSSGDEKSPSRTTAWASSQLPSSKHESSQTSEPKQSERAQVPPPPKVTQLEERPSVEKIASAPQSALVNPITAQKSDQVIPPAAEYVSNESQIAKEVARVLATNNASNTQRGFGTGAAPGLSDRIGQNSRVAEKPTAESKEPTNTTRQPAVEAKTEDAAKVSEFEKLIRLVRASSGKQSTARIMLDPPELGKVHVRVVVEGDRVEVGVETENDAARQIIAERAAKLKSVLEENGFMIDRFDVAVNQDGLFDARTMNRQTVQHQTSSQTESETKGRSRRLAATSTGGKWSPIQALNGMKKGFDFEV